MTRKPARGGDAFRAKLVSLEATATLAENPAQALVIFAAQLEGDRLLSARRLAGFEAPLGTNEVYLVFRRDLIG